MADTRYVYGACCNWHGSIHEVFKGTIPGCPICHGPLLELSSKKEWDEGVENFTKMHDEPLYPKFVEYSRSNHQPNPGNWKSRFEKFKLEYVGRG